MNVCASTLISVRLWMHRQAITQAIGSPQGTFYLGYMAMTLESAVLYTVFVIIALVVFSLNSPLENVFFPVLGTVQVCVARFIIVIGVMGAQTSGPRSPGNCAVVDYLSYRSWDLVRDGRIRVLHGGQSAFCIVRPSTSHPTADPRCIRCFRYRACLFRRQRQPARLQLVHPRNQRQSLSFGGSHENDQFKLAYRHLRPHHRQQIYIKDNHTINSFSTITTKQNNKGERKRGLWNIS